VKATLELQLQTRDILKPGTSLYLNEIQSISNIKELFFEKSDNITILQERIFSRKDPNYSSHLIIGPKGCGKSVTVEHLVNTIPNAILVFLNCKYDASGTTELLKNIYNQLKLKAPGFWNENTNQIDEYLKINILYAIKYILFNVDAPIYIVFDEFDAAYDTYNNSMNKHILSFFSNIYEGYEVKGSESHKPLDVTTFFLTNKKDITQRIAPDMMSRLSSVVYLQHYDESDLSHILRLRVNYCFKPEFVKNTLWTRTIANRADDIAEGDSRTAIRLLKAFTNRLVEDPDLDMNNEDLVNEAILSIETEDKLRQFDCFEEDKKLTFWQIIITAQISNPFTFDQVFQAYSKYCLTHRSTTKQKHERTIRYYFDDMKASGLIEDDRTRKQISYNLIVNLPQALKFLNRKGYSI
jgi:Cdc6-like AAA superfamily ATPase